MRRQSQQYSPWVTANLTLDRLPKERGLDLAWDNVMYDSHSLGYVVGDTYDTEVAHRSLCLDLVHGTVGWHAAGRIARSCCKSRGNTGGTTSSTIYLAHILIFGDASLVSM